MGNGRTNPSEDILARGKAVYEKWCAHAHAPQHDNPGTQALQAKYQGSKPAALIHRTDLTPELIRDSVRGGNTIMPFFRKTEISDEDLDALIVFLTSGSGAA